MSRPLTVAPSTLPHTRPRSHTAAATATTARPRAIAAAVLLTAVSLLPSTARAIDFDFFYTDPDGQYFFDPAQGDQRRAALETAGHILGQYIEPSYVGESIIVRVNSYVDSGSNVLAAAAPDYFYGNFGSADPRYQTDTHYPKALASHLLGAEIQADHDDITMKVNFGNNFYFGTDGATPASQTDFISVAMHELMHGLGIFGSVREDGSYGYYGDGTYSTIFDVSGFPTPFDRFTRVGNFPILSLSSDERADGMISNNLFFAGPAARSVSGNSPQLFAPNPFQDGSTGSHLDSSAFPNDPMAPSIGTGQVRQTLSPVDRGILRDIGWNISVAASNVPFTGAAGDNLASSPANWTQRPLPGDNLAFGNNTYDVFDVSMDLILNTVGQISFDAESSPYTLRFRSYTDTEFTGAGIVNGAPDPHTFVLETYQDDVNNNTIVPATVGRAATLSFRAGASAANTLFEVHAGFSTIHTEPNLPPFYDRYSGAAVNFYDASSADHATFHVQGAQGSAAFNTYARVTFHNTADAGNATFVNQPGRAGASLDGRLVAGDGAQTVFYDASSAAVASITNQGQDTAPEGTGGITLFHDTSTAYGATIDNLGATAVGGTGGVTQFFDDSSAAFASITNHPSLTFDATVGFGTTTFTDTASAGNATFDNLGGDGSFHLGGVTSFHGNASAANATLNNHASSNGGAAGLTQFYDDSSASHATIHNLSGPGQGGITQFFDRSTAASANLDIPTPDVPGQNAGTIGFHDASSAGSATLTARPSTFSHIIFYDTSSAASATFTLDSNSSSRVVFTDSASAGNASFDVFSTGLLQFQVRSTAANANINIRAGGVLNFIGDYDPADNPTSTADHAVIHLFGGSPAAASGAAAYFSTWTTAGDASFTVDGGAAPYTSGASLEFGDRAHAGNATIHLLSPASPNATGGHLRFYKGATADSATIIADAGSVVDFGGNAYYGGTSVGSLQGPGSIYLSGSTLTVGALGLDNTLSGPLLDAVNSGGALVKVGPASLTLAGANRYSGPTTVAQGSLHLAGSNVVASDYVTAPGATLYFDAPHSIASLTGDGATVVSAPLVAQTISQAALTLHAPLSLLPDSGPSTLASLSLDPAASLDLSNNSLTLTSTTDAVRLLILAGQLTSSAPDPNNLTTLGYLPLSPLPAIPTDPRDVLIQLTYTGDANLDGQITPDDYALLDRSFARALTDAYWSDGDFNYDGIIDASDYLAIDTTLGKVQGLSPGFLAQRESQFGTAYVSTLLATVPEPAPALSSLLYLLSSLPLARRRRRRSRK